MTAVIEQMLKGYHVESMYDRKNAMKEIMQEIVLCGLSRAGFFRKAALYGGTAVNQEHLKKRLVQSGFIAPDAECGLSEIKKMLCERFDAIHFARAKADVEPFIRDLSVLDVWSAGFFKQIAEGLTAC